MRVVCEFFFLLCIGQISLQDTNEINEPIDAEKFQLIFPGTKWCGQGNIASNDSDYGVFAETDMCCRTHDYCPDSIGSGEIKHGLTNNGLFTKVHCDCETDFHRCLKTVNSIVSQKIGYTYFNVVGSECFKEEYPILRCRKYSKILPLRCAEYELDTTKLMIWQFFDNQLY